MATPTVKYFDGAAWQDISADVRSYSYTSGRLNENAGVSPGVANLVLDNSDSTFVAVGVNLLPKSTPIQILVSGSPRFTGFVDASPVTFLDSEGTASFVALSCVDALSLLQRYTCSTSSVEYMTAAVNAAGAGGFWPCSDAPGSTSLAEVVGITPFGAMVPGVNSDNETGAGPQDAGTLGVPGPGVLQGTAFSLAAITTADSNTHEVSRISSSASFDTTGGFTFGGYFSSSGVVSGSPIMYLNGPHGHLNTSVQMLYGADPSVIVTVYDATAANSVTVNISLATFAPASGSWHAIVVTVSSVGVVNVYIDDVLLGTGTAGAWNPSATWQVGVQARLLVFDGFAPYSTAQIAAMFLLQGVNPVSLPTFVMSLGGQGSPQALGHLASWAAPSVATSFDTQNNAIPAPAGGVTVAGNDALTISQTFARSEDGPLFVGRDGTITNLTHLTLADHANGAPVAAFVNGDTEPNLTLARDAQFLVTKCEITAASGSGVVQTVSKNLTKFGLYGLQDTLYLTDSAAMDYANWHIYVFSDVNYGRISQFSVDLLNSVDIQTAALALNVGSRATLSGLPAQGGFTSADLIIQGFTEDWTIDGWRITFNTTPSSNYLGWILEDATYGLLDSTTVLYY